MIYFFDFVMYDYYYNYLFVRMNQPQGASHKTFTLLAVFRVLANLHVG